MEIIFSLSFKQEIVMKILIADKQPIYRDGLKHNLNIINPGAVVLDASSLGQINDVLRQNNDIDLLLTDIDMMLPDWENKARELLSSPGYPRVGVMTNNHNQSDAKKANDIGLCCYLPKNIELHTFEQALYKVLRGENYYLPIDVSDFKSPTKLTNRQFEVLKYLAQGLSNKQIAYYMNVSEATVKLHINALLRAIEATNRTQAVVKSQKIGLI